MKTHEIKQVAEAITSMAEAMNFGWDEVLEYLTGQFMDEEEAGEVRDYITENN